MKQTSAPKPGAVTLEAVQASSSVMTFMEKGNSNLGTIGYTEHGERHAKIVAKWARTILEELGYDRKSCELAAIGGFLHDIGNAVNRKTHGQAGAMLAYHILGKMGMNEEDIASVMAAVANHDENEGDPVSAISAAVIIADKSDAHRSRVRNPKEIDFDIHDRVNYAVTSSHLFIDKHAKTITLCLTIDDRISKVMEYFEIFLSRMLTSKRAAKLLNCEFKLTINDQKIL